MPVGVELLVAILSVDWPEPPLTDVELKLAVAPFGRPETLRPTESVNPPDPETLTV